MDAEEAEAQATVFPSRNPRPDPAPTPPHTPPISRGKIDAALHLMAAEELAEAHRFAEVWERAGYMGPAEASAWRERIAVWRRFGRQGQPPKQVADPLLDDPDPFL